MKKILYMGTTDYSAYILEQLISNNFNICAIISQPDRKVGRKQILSPTPVKEIGINNNIKVYDFDNINDNYDILKDSDFDIMITCAYGQKISKEILSLSKYKPLNVHASLLPKYRGGAPIQYAIFNNENKTGNTIMVMEEGLDSGAIISQSSIDILKEDTYSSLSNKLMKDGADLLINTLPNIFNNTNSYIKQDEVLVTYSYNIKRSFELINFNRDVKDVYNHMRALLDIPGCYAYYHNKKIKFYNLDYIEDNHNHDISSISFDNNSLYVYCLNGYIKVNEIQLEGKKRVKIKDYLNGNNLELKDKMILNKDVVYEY